MWLVILQLLQTPLELVDDYVDLFNRKIKVLYTYVLTDEFYCATTDVA